MKINKNFFILALFSISSLTHADWDSRCLDTCFKTGHDCNYCNYQCYRDDNDTLKPNRSGNTVCPYKLEQNYGREY